MSWAKNGLLLATGGIIGLCVAAAIEADNDGAERSSEGLRDVDGIAVLGEKLRREAEWAMEECTSDEERDAVLPKSRHPSVLCRRNLPSAGRRLSRNWKRSSRRKET